MTEQNSSLSRRKFVATAAGGAAAVSAGSLLLDSATALARPDVTKGAASETLVTTLYKSLSEEQREAICLPFDHPLRSKVDNNWHINKTRVSQFSKDQHPNISLNQWLESELLISKYLFLQTIQ